MKKVLAKIFSGGRRAPFWISLSFVAAGASAVPLQEARVSQVIQDVRLLEAHAAPRPAVVNDKVIFGSAVRTGVESRTELTFKDLTITRLGANTIFSFTAGARQAELTQGAILIQVPPNAAPVRANTTAITVAVTGGTALLATGPPTKFMVLEGIGTIYPRGHPEKAVTVHGGEMVIAENGHISNPEKFDVKLVLETSPLILDFPPLANLPLILAVVDQQLAEQQLAGATTQPLARNFVDVIDVTDQNANANPVVVEERIGTPSPTVSPPPPPPPPSKFGTPVPISAPNPYLITSGTVITTDPSITTNGVTDFGKIYRGSADDGAFSLWAFGSTSAFDTALNIDTEFFADPNHLPIAVFEFQNLSLIGDPTIDTSNGGVTKLALIGVNGITSGPPGGTLTFTGLDLLVLATVNGSISLTSDVSFQNLNELAMYARGAGSNLILNSPISNIGTLELAAEGSIQLTNPGTMSVGDFHATAGDDLTLQIGGSLLLNGKVRLNTLVLPGTTVASGANLTLNITGDYTNSSATEFSRLRVTNEGAHIGTGGNISASIGGDFTTGFDSQFVVDNVNGTINNGGNLTLDVGGNLTTHAFSLLIENWDFTANPAGHIGSGGNLLLTTGGNFTADSASIAINNRGGGTIDSAASIVVNIGGALTTLKNGSDFLGNPTSLEIDLATRFDNQLGNTNPSAIGGDATVNVHADSASIGGLFDITLSDRGGSIGGNALLSFHTTHDTNLLGVDTTIGTASFEAAVFEILNDSGPPVNGADTPLGGTIHGDATLQVSTANLAVPNGSLDIFINNQIRAVTGGTIDGSAVVDLSASAISVGKDFSVYILNGRNTDATGTNGGSIGANAAVNIAATSLSVGGGFLEVIRNVNNSSVSSGTGGNIAGSAAVSLDITGDISVTNDFDAGIGNQRAAGTALGPSGGSIGSDATVSISASSISVGGFLQVLINNQNNGSGTGAGGSIGGNAAMNLNITNTLSSGGPATFQIFNPSNVAGSPGGSIGGDATINVSAANVSTGDYLFADILNYSSGNIGGNANLNLNLTGDLTTQGAANFTIDNSNGGTIGGSANVAVNIGNNVTALNGIDVHISNSNSGHIVSGADVLYSVGGSTSTTDLTEYIDNSNGGVIDNGGNVTLHTVGPVMLDGALVLEVDNFNGGTINNGANVTAHFVGDVTDTAGQFHSLNWNLLNGSGFFNPTATGGTIGTGGNLDITFDGNASTTGTPTTGSISAQIENGNGGSIGTGGNISMTVGGNLNAGPLFLITENQGGHIGTGGSITLGVSGNITTQGDANFQIFNEDEGSGGGTIGSDATINVTANNISTGGALYATINNTGGSIGGQAAINMNVPGTTTVTNDATVAIYGSDGAASAAININGGSYNAGGQFLTYIDGDGTITFNNASAHADVLKVGALGANGVLNIGGGMLSADTTLKLYASGSNGQLNFLSNVTLGGNSIKILAADSVTIFDNIVVTINGPAPAEVFTTNANYTGFGGNGTTTGTFAGAGANNPLPLNQAPPFGAPPPSPARRGNITTINVSNTADLLALLDGAVVGPDGRITISDSRNITNLRNLSRIDMNGLPRGARRMLINEMRERSTMRAGGRRIL